MRFCIVDSGIHPDAEKLLVEQGFTKSSASDAEVLFVRLDSQVNKEFLISHPSVRFILKAGVGLETIDLAACKERNVEVFNAPGANANAVAEMIVGLVLAANRHIVSADQKLRQGVWDRFSYLGWELKWRTFGLIGFGAIGKAVHKKLRGLDMNLIIYDPYLTKEAVEAFEGAKKVEQLDDLLKQSDVVSIQVPLTKETENLISKKNFSLFKKDALLINISRGGIVNEADLVEALKSKTIRAAALDVFVNEPDYDKKLLEAPHLVMTPHIATMTQEANREMCLLPVRRLVEHLKK